MQKKLSSEQVAQNRAVDMLAKKEQMLNKQYDRNINDIQFKIGQMVLVKNNAGHKMENQYSGPFKVIYVTEQNFTVIDNRRKHVGNCTQK